MAVCNKKKPIIGILGGICSGKSTVAAEFAKLGCKVVDADKIAHELLDEPAIKEQVVGFFGEGVLDSTRRIDRKKLADIVFSDRQRWSQLNSIMHPEILARTEKLISQYNQAPLVKAIVLDMPLLAEVGWLKRCDKTLFIDCEEQLRVARARKRCYFEENELRNRENFQISLDKKAGLADNVIDNNSVFSVLVKQVADIYLSLTDG